MMTQRANVLKLGSRKNVTLAQTFREALAESDDVPWYEQALHIITFDISCLS